MDRTKLLFLTMLCFAVGCDDGERRALAVKVVTLQDELKDLRARAQERPRVLKEVKEWEKALRSAGFPVDPDDDDAIGRRIGAGSVRIERTVRGLRAVLSSKKNPGAGITMLGASLPLATLESAKALFGGTVEVTFIAEGPEGCTGPDRGRSSPKNRRSEIESLASAQTVEELSKRLANAKSERRRLLNVISSADLDERWARYRCMRTLLSLDREARGLLAQRVKIAAAAVRRAGDLKELQFEDGDAVVVPYSAAAKRRLRAALEADSHTARDAENGTVLRVPLAG